MSARVDIPDRDRWLIALDIDGTLLSKDGVLSPSVREAITAAIAAGHEVVIATGRSLRSTTPVYEMLGINKGWAISSNGSVTFRLDPAHVSLDPMLPDGIELTDVITFDPGPALRLIRQHVPGAIFAVENLGIGFFLTEHFPDGELDGEMEVVDFERLCELSATRVTIRAPEQTSEDFLTMVDRLGLHGLTYAVGWLAWLDVNPDGVSKASALEVVRERVGVAPGRTIAIGDGRNDIEMLQWAARGVAMGDSAAEVIAAADEVTGTVEEDGAVRVIEQFLS